ncbi:RNA-binding protein RO60-like [Corticium candelabrum]|uniref:RNA-binding protein RO60-like n=1 Tax=Corticium candelabrum TaxID=121492 RepID=UPI002E25BC06|nr:RNA-binding protein RO60-like [Corticium candelabrum]
MTSSISPFHESEAMDESEEPSCPQSRPLSGKQVRGNAGGFVFAVSDLNRLRRFLCLGSEGGTYYVGEKKLGLENAQCISRLLADGKGTDVIEEIVSFSQEGRAAKQNPIIFALALCARIGDVDVKRAAYEVLSRVCRIPTHLFAFVDFCESLSSGTGWGRAHRRAVQEWYNAYEKRPLQLAMAVTKYKQRNGWSHLDLARLSHIKPSSDGVALVVKAIVKGLGQAEKDYGSNDDPVIQKTLSFLKAAEDVKTLQDEEKVVAMIHKHTLVREHIPTIHLNSCKVWDALLDKMPLTAMIRNLGKMSSIGLLSPLSDQAKMVCHRLQNNEALRNARIHPFNVLLALKTYQKGRGEKGKLVWDVNQTIVDSLDDAFYKSFKFVEPTGKRFLLAIDVSGSMDSPVNGSSIEASTAAAAMSMVTARCEKNYHMLGFSHELVRLPISPKMRLDTVVEEMNKVPMGATDCAQPMQWAIKNKAKVDVFIVYTDCETWFGSVHPCKALKLYRQEMAINAKLIVCGMTSNGFTIADPDDAGMLDMAGFDSAAPEVIRNFVLGKI